MLKRKIQHANLTNVKYFEQSHDNFFIPGVSLERFYQQKKGNKQKNIEFCYKLAQIKNHPHACAVKFNLTAQICQRESMYGDDIWKAGF